MKGITDSTVEEIKARIELSDLIASYGIAVKIAGASKKACCPFHHEKTPSFNINDARGFYHCFGCGESGDAIKFVQKFEGLSFADAVKRLAERCGVTIEEREDPAAGKRARLYALLAELAQFYHRCLIQAKEGERARAYLKERALDGAIADDYQIGYAPSGVTNILTWAEKYKYTPGELEQAGVIVQGKEPGDRGYHRFGGRLMFSIRDRQGRVVGFSGRQLVASKNSGKYVNSPETPVFSKKRILYGFDKAMRAIAQDKKNHEVIICEGQIDCIRLQTSGFPNAVAGQGTAFTEDHVAMLKKVADLVTLVYDDDGAGHKATIKSARLCLAADLPVRVVSLPSGDDPDSFLRTHPAEEFRAMLEGAESIMSFQVRAERAKEPNPNSVDAISRITREILLTIATCPNAVLRAAMTGEAAKLLGLPSVALENELRKVPVESRRPAFDHALDMEAEVSDESVPDDELPASAAEPQDAAKVLPPSRKEIALCELLLANEYETALDGKIGEFLPPEVFRHDFTRRFVETWRQECAKGEDLFASFSETLTPTERAWFDAIYGSADKSCASGRTPEENLEDLIRTLWADELKRRRGALPAVGDQATERQLVTLLNDSKLLPTMCWEPAKDLIRTYIKGER